MDNYLLLLLFVGILITLYVYQDRIFINNINANDERFVKSNFKIISNTKKKVPTKLSMDDLDETYDDSFESCGSNYSSNFDDNEDIDNYSINSEMSGISNMSNNDIKTVGSLGSIGSLTFGTNNDEQHDNLENDSSLSILD